MKRTSRTLLAAACVCALASCAGAQPSSSVSGGGGMPAVAVTSRDLGGLAPTDCAIKSFLDQLGACTARPVRQVSGTGTAANIGSAADGDACTAWTSGGMAPQSVDLDLGEAASVTTLLVIPDLTPPTGDVQHDIQIFDAKSTQRQAVTVSGPMTSGHGYAIQLPAPVEARLLHISTSRAPGWVAWREIVPLSCR